MDNLSTSQSSGTLTPAQIAAVRSAAGASPLPASGSAPSLVSQLGLSKVASPASTTPDQPSNPTPASSTQTPDNSPENLDQNPILNAASDFGNTLADTYTKQINGESGGIVGDIMQGAQRMSQAKTALGKIGYGAETGLNVAGDTVTTLFAPISATLKGLADTISDPNNPEVQNIAQQPWLSGLLNLVDKATSAVSDFSTSHPELSQDIGSAANVILGSIGSGELDKPVGDAFASAKASVDKLTNSVGQGVEKTANYVSDVASSAAKGVKEVLPKSAPTTEPDTLNPEGRQVTPEAARKSAWNDIQPKATPTTKLAYAKAGNVTDQSLFKGAELKPSAADSKLLDSISPLYEDKTLTDSMSPNEKMNAVDQKAAQLHGQQKDFLASHDKAVTLSDPKGGTGILDKLESTAKESSLPFSKDPATKGAYDSAIETFKSQLETGKSAGTVSGATTLSKLDSALTKFDQTMQRFSAWGRGKTGEITDTALARQQAIRDIHTTVRDFISENLPKNSPWQYLRSQESNLYQISDRIAQRVADTVGQSKVTQAMKNNPIASKMVKGAASATGVGAAIHLIP